jgi:hypothetical protein
MYFISFSHLLSGWTPQQKGAGGQEADATLAALDPWVVLYDDLVFGRQIGKGNFGRVFEGTYFGTTHHHQPPPPHTTLLSHVRYYSPLPPPSSFFYFYFFYFLSFQARPWR